MWLPTLRARGRKLSRPRPDTPPKLIKLEQAHPLACARRRPCLSCVVAPRRQVESDVLEILVGRDVLERLEAILDEPDAWASTAGFRIRVDQRSQVVTLVRPGLLALDVRQLHAPLLQDEPGEFAFLGGHENASLGLADQPAELIERTVCRVVPDPAGAIGGDPLAPHVVEGFREPGDQLIPWELSRACRLVAHAGPVPEDVRLLPALTDGAEEQRHLPARHDDGAEPPESGEES